MKEDTITKKEIEIVGRKIQVRVITPNPNKSGGITQRVYAKFLDSPIDKVNYDEESKSLRIGKKQITKEQIQELKKIIDKIPDDEI